MSEKIDILVIDDNDIQLEYLDHLFTSHGYSVHTIQDGTNAITALKQYKPRLVLLDIMMPQIDGFTVLKQIREEKEFKSLPVIIYSSKSFPVDQKKALRLGADAYLVKPVKGSVIIEKIEKYLEGT